MQALRHAADKATENLGRKDGATSGHGDKGTDAVLNGYTVGRVKQVTALQLGICQTSPVVEVQLPTDGVATHKSCLMLLSLPEHIYRGVPQSAELNLDS